MGSRPDWWPAWVPERDSEGHELAPGKVARPRCDCVGAVHHLFKCRVIDCDAPAAKPEGCAG